MITMHRYVCGESKICDNTKKPQNIMTISADVKKLHVFLDFPLLVQVF